MTDNGNEQDESLKEIFKALARHNGSLLKAIFIVFFPALLIVVPWGLYQLEIFSQATINQTGIVLNFMAGFMVAPDLIGQRRIARLEGIIEKNSSLVLQALQIFANRFEDLVDWLMFCSGILWLITLVITLSRFDAVMVVEIQLFSLVLLVISMMFHIVVSEKERSPGRIIKRLYYVIPMLFQFFFSVQLSLLWFLS